ncbi:hypothetical protein Pen01_61100 [Phytomonospora endophytica]|nr:hypothetical protein Pen01_61100 [Phytomonospora endophytica]
MAVGRRLTVRVLLRRLTIGILRLLGLLAVRILRLLRLAVGILRLTPAPSCGRLLAVRRLLLAVRVLRLAISATRWRSVRGHAVSFEGIVLRTR